MALTRLDCDFYRGHRSNIESSSFVAFNAGRVPGGMVAAGSLAIRASIGSQIASRLSLEHFVEGVLDYYEQKKEGEAESEEPSLPALEAAFKRANHGVYQFGHKLAAGGRLATAIIGLVIEGRSASAGRVGGMGAYLYRDRKLYPFFEKQEDPENFLGINSLVTVETATIEVEGGDLLFLFSRMLNEEQEQKLSDAARTRHIHGGVFRHIFIPKIFGYENQVEFAMVAMIGPEAIYLAEKL